MAALEVLRQVGLKAPAAPFHKLICKRAKLFLIQDCYATVFDLDEFLAFKISKGSDH